MAFYVPWFLHPTHSLSLVLLSVAFVWLIVDVVDVFISIPNFPAIENTYFEILKHKRSYLLDMLELLCTTVALTLLGLPTAVATSQTEQAAEAPLGLIKVQIAGLSLELPIRCGVGLRRYITKSLL